MNHAEFQLRGVSDPRLAVHATSATPAWLWSVDSTRILWANPVGARLFNAAHGAALAQDFRTGGFYRPDRATCRQAAIEQRSGWSGCAAGRPGTLVPAAAPAVAVAPSI
jgi:hypothetical protein